MNYASNAGVFLVQTLFGLYLLCVLLRFLLQYFQADFRNPLSQFLVTVTNPPLKLLRRVVPGFRGIDFSSLILALIIAALEIFLVRLMLGRGVSLPSMVFGSLGIVLQTIVYIFIIAIIIRIVLSWVQPQGSGNPAIGLLYSITEPVMSPARRMLPPIGGLDLSPIITMIFLMLILIVPVRMLLDAAGM